MDFKDILGTKINKGDFVAIAQRSGNSGHLAVAIVLDTFVNDNDISTIRVIGGKKNWEGEFAMNSRHGDSFPEKVVVLKDREGFGILPTDVEDKLDQAYMKYWKM